MPPPRARPVGRRSFFRAFSAHFCVTLEHLFFKRQKRRRKICGKSARKWAQKSAHQKSAQKWAQKSAHQKWAQKWAEKSAHQKSAQKNQFEHSICLEDGSQKKKNTHTKKICAKLAQNPSPKKYLFKMILALIWQSIFYLEKGGSFARGVFERDSGHPETVEHKKNPTTCERF